ncbi:MAG: glycosyltransferase family 4 protein [Erysipelotrichaceae bacterium]
MKVCLYFEAEKMIQTSGIGRAFKHQKAALTSVGVEYTTSLDDDYDILHINTVGPSSYSIVNKAKKEGKKVIYHAHSTEEDFRDSFILSNHIAPFFKKHIVALYTKADLILTPTPYSKQLLENYGLKPKIYDLSNGIDLERFHYNEDKVEAFRKYFSLKPEDKVVLSVGLYFERKGILDFMEVAKKLPEYKFIWFGHTPLYSIPKEVRSAIKNPPSNVILPGYVKGPIIEGAYSNADLFFFPSKEETEGIVVLEALAAHQEVLLRDIPVYDPWMQNGKNCFKGKDNEEFVQLIKQIINRELPSTADIGEQTAYERSVKQIGERLKAIYEEVLD